MEDIIKKLQIKEQSKLLVIELPEELEMLKSNLKGDVSEEVKTSHDFILIFAYQLSDAKEKIQQSIHTLEEDQLFWFCYPKKSSKKYKSDINRNKCWDLLSEYNFRPVRQISLNDDWSAMRFRNEKYVKK